MTGVPIDEDGIEAVATAAVEREADQMERDTDGAGTLDRWAACDEPTRERYRADARADVSAYLGAVGARVERVEDESEEGEPLTLGRLVFSPWKPLTDTEEERNG